MMLCTMALSAQLPDADYWHRKQIGFNWLFDEDTVSINRLHVGDGKFGIDSLGKMIYYNGAAIAAGDLLRGTAGGGSYTKLAKGTPLQVLRVNSGGTDLEWATVGPATVTGLSNQQVLYGKSDGTIDQEAAFTYDESINSLIIQSGSDASLLNQSSFTVTDGTNIAGYYAERIEMNDGTYVATITLPTLASGYNWNLPTAQGGANTDLTNDGSGNLSWQLDNGYCLQFSGGQFNPNDATTYYFGINPQSSGVTDGVNRIYIPRAGTITACYLVFDNSGTLGTTETSTLSIRLNNTTDYTVSSSVANNVRPTVYNNTALNIAVAAGDYIELKWACPTWSTNPTQVRLQAVVNIQ